MRNKIAVEFAPAKESVSWAEDAINEFEATIGAFLQGDVAEVIVEADNKTDEQVQKVRFRRDIPRDFRRKATEALVNTKHACDQATFAARNLISGPTNSSVYFPWAHNPTDLERLLKARGIDERLWSVFARQEPYGRGEGHSGGDDVIRALAKLANDKHTIGLSVNAHIVSTGFPDIDGKTVRSLRILNPTWNPVKKEAELIRWIGDLEISGNYKFYFEIVLKGIKLPQPVSAIAGLTAFTNKAKVVIQSLETRCVELLG